jgi:hypothetical protein
MTKKLSEENKDSLTDGLVSLREYFSGLEGVSVEAVLQCMLDFAKDGLKED